jgi:hypothetical protein
MRNKSIEWKKGRGKLGIFQPILGTWKADTDSDMGKVTCLRTFTKVLDNKYVQLSAIWKYKSGTYEELAMYGVDLDKNLRFWSFTSDGKQSQGYLADVSDIHPQAFGFEANMPAGLGRMIFWPDEEEGFHWAVEAKTKKGWKRFTQHHYLPVIE